MLHKKAFQSSTDESPQGDPGGAVDGNLANKWLDGDLCSHTLYDYQAWWAVDMGETYMLDYVTLTNRVDYGKSTLIPFLFRGLYPFTLCWTVQ